MLGSCNLLMDILQIEKPLNCYIRQGVGDD